MSFRLGALAEVLRDGAVDYFSVFGLAAAAVSDATAMFLHIEEHGIQLQKWRFAPERKNLQLASIVPPFSAEHVGRCSYSEGSIKWKSAAGCGEYKWKM